MTEKEFSGLAPGQVVRGKSIGQGYIVTGNYGTHVTAVRTVDLTNPDEWDLVVVSTSTPPAEDAVAKDVARFGRKLDEIERLQRLVLDRQDPPGGVE